MKKIILSLIAVILLTACSVDSPISATQTFFKQIQDKNFSGACQMMANSQSQPLTEDQLKNCTEYYKTDYANLSSFTVENALPLGADDLKKYGSDQGFTVYYTVNLNPEVKHEEMIVLKVNGKHALVWKR